ncbi:MAG: hypothetical protein EB059_09940 [Alphaproteobacteria bacterium]|nr:hypothetical protein [Alphaproteobacteria bacterium]
MNKQKIADSDILYMKEIEAMLGTVDLAQTPQYVLITHPDGSVEVRSRSNSYEKEHDKIARSDYSRILENVVADMQLSR